MPSVDPLASALDRVGDRWALLVVAALLEGAGRFNDIQAAVPGIATNVLTQRLRQLETAGVVVARPYSTRPLRYTYDLTASGLDLADALRLLAKWGGATGDPAGEGPVHPLCGTPLEVRWWCPTCERTADGGDEDQGILA